MCERNVTCDSVSSNASAIFAGYYTSYFGCDARTGSGPETFVAAHCDSEGRTRHMHRKNIHVRCNTGVRADAALVRTKLLYVSTWLTAGAWLVGCDFAVCVGDQEKYRKQVARMNTNERGVFVVCSTNYYYIVQLRIGALCQTSPRMTKALIRYRTHGNCSREAMLTYTSHLNLQQCCRACMCMFFISAPPKIVSWEAGALSLLQS